MQTSYIVTCRIRSVSSQKLSAKHNLTSRHVTFRRQGRFFARDVTKCTLWDCAWRVYVRAKYGPRLARWGQTSQNIGAARWGIGECVNVQHEAPSRPPQSGSFTTFAACVFWTTAFQIPFGVVATEAIWILPPYRAWRRCHFSNVAALRCKGRKFYGVLNVRLAHSIANAAPAIGVAIKALITR